MRLEDIFLIEDHKTYQRVKEQIYSAAAEIGGWNSPKVPKPLQAKITELVRDASALADRDVMYGENRPKKSEINAIKRRANAIEAALEKL